MKLLNILIFSLCIVATQIGYAQPSPVPMLENTATKIIDTLKQNQSRLAANHQIAYEAINRYLVPNVDLTGMSRSVLGRNAWNKASISEKNAFVQAFTTLVIRTYASPLAEYSGETVKFLPLRANNDSRFIRVNSIISRPNGQRIPLSYNLIYVANKWKIYDLSVEGVSLLQSFRSQFAQVLQSSTINDLIQQMHQRSKVA